MLRNIGLSLAIITVLMPLALLGVLGLAAVVLVHEIDEVLLIADGVRAGRTRALTTSLRTDFAQTVALGLGACASNSSGNGRVSHAGHVADRSPESETKP
jgi:hypothetical protein